MLKQFFINKYFHKLCKEKFFKNDEDSVIGSAENVIHMLKENIKYAKNVENSDNKEWAEFIIAESNSLIYEISRTYKNKKDIIGLYNSPMSGFYMLYDRSLLLEELEEYYKELED